MLDDISPGLIWLAVVVVVSAWALASELLGQLRLRRRDHMDPWQRRALIDGDGPRGFEVKAKRE